MESLLFGLCYLLFALVLVHNVLAVLVFRVLQKMGSGFGQATSPRCDVLPATFVELMAYIWTAKARAIDTGNVAAMVVWLRILQTAAAIIFLGLLVSAYLT